MQLPLEIVGPILEHLTRDLRQSSLRSAAALQLVSRRTRAWVLPTLFYVYVVYLPKTQLSMARKWSSLAFLIGLIENQQSPPRRHIRHIVFTTSENRYSFSTVPFSPLGLRIRTAPMHIDSLTLAQGQYRTDIRLLNLIPRRLLVINSAQTFFFTEIASLNPLDPGILDSMIQLPPLSDLQELCWVGSIARHSAAGNANVGGGPLAIGAVGILTINGFALGGLLEILSLAARKYIPSSPIALLPIRLNLDSHLTTPDVISALIIISTTLVQIPRVSVALILTGRMAEDPDLPRRLREDLPRHHVIAAHPKLQARINFDFRPAEKRLKDGHSYAAALRAGEDPWESGPVLNEAGAVAS